MFVIRPVTWHFAWWLLLAPLLLLELYALHSLQEQFALTDPSHAHSVMATVVEQHDTGSESLLRYEFQLPGDATIYSAADLAGRRELWTPVTAQAARQATMQNQIEIRYLAENPWANQPVGRTGNPIADSFAGWILFLLIDIVWLAETMLIVRNYARVVVACERQQPLRLRFWRSLRADNTYQAARRF